MFFTEDDYRKIEEWLLTRTIKDTQFPPTDPLKGDEEVPIIQDKKNKTLTVNELVKQVAMMELPDFFNVTAFSKTGNLFLEQAINLVPAEQRKLGLAITFHSEKGNWRICQFKGTSLNQWSNLLYWRSLIEEALDELIFYPDEEDITGIADGNRTFLKFKDRNYDPSNFSGMGRIILRKNLVGTEACSIDDEDHFSNILTQDMIREENTVYIVQYDFDLDGKVISIPKGCTLWFQGGSINNGTIYLQETAILGAFEFADMGNAKLFGKFNTGQVMTFSDDSYKAKTGGYFVASIKGSSATIEEDAKNDSEPFYGKNPRAYVDSTRQELRWWNGEKWLLILDITDYAELRSIINDLIDKHNAEMSACYKYFKARCYALEVRMDNAEDRLDDHESRLNNHENRLNNHENRLNDHENRIDNHELRITKNEGDIKNIKANIVNIENNIENIENSIDNIENNISDINYDISNITNNIEDILNSITNLGDVINNLDQTIENHIQQFIENNVIGVNSVTVNGQKYTPDSSGNINLPDYPSPEGGPATSTMGTLRFTGASNESFDGSRDVTVNIPEGGSSTGTTIVAKELLTIKQGDSTLGTYDGTEPKTIIIPASSGPGEPSTGGIADRVAHKLKFTGAVSAEYDGSEEVSVNIPTGGGNGGSSTPNQPLIFKGAVEETYDGTSQKIVTIPSPTTVTDLDTKNLVIKDSDGNAAVTYNAKEPKEIQFKKLHVKANTNDTNSLPGGVSDTARDGSLASYDIDLLKGNGTVDMTKVNYGTDKHPIILYAAKIQRSSSTYPWQAFISYMHPFLSVQVSLDTSAVKIQLNSADNNNYMKIHSAVATFCESEAKRYNATVDTRERSEVVGLRCGIDSNTVIVQGLRTGNKDNDTVEYDPAKSGGKLLAFYIIIVGHINR